MKDIFRQTQLYKFIKYCNETEIEKSVLDCGAGGNCPPLALFAEHGYRAVGIEMSESQIESANKFISDRGLNVEITKGDMRKLPFKDEAFGFAYSYNSIFHMTKADIKKSMDEIKRVIKPEGLCFVNFLSVDDEDCGVGKVLGRNEFIQNEDGEEVIHCYYEDSEAEDNFDGMEIVFKEKRLLERIYEGKIIKQGYIDYILKKR